jgi:hypothetical protein
LQALEERIKIVKGDVGGGGLQQVVSQLVPDPLKPVLGLLHQDPP